MFNRLFPLTVFLLSLVASNEISARSNDNFSQQRALYAQLQETISSTPHRRSLADATLREIKSLSDYSLYPYLQLSLLKRNLHKKSVDEIQSFLTTYKKLPFKHNLRIAALKAKFKQKQWQDVIALSQPGDSTKYRCMLLSAQYKSAHKKQALSQVNKLWLHGSSLPKQCDFIIQRWKKAKMQTSAITLNRIELTLINRNGKLAKYLAKSLNADDKATYLYWKKLYNKPTLLSKNHYWQQRGHFANVMLNIAVERLTHRSIKRATQLLPKIRKHIGFTQQIQKRLVNNIALRALLKKHDDKPPTFWLAKLHWQPLTSAKQEQILRYLVGQSQWSLITKLFNMHYKNDSNASLEWQYWYASSLAKLGQKHEATKRYQAIAKKRRYYGFLASDKLKIPYSLNHQPLPQDPIIIKALSSNPYLVRAKELYLLNSDLPARREWYQLVKPLTQEQRIGAAHIAHQWGWHNRAIITLTMTDQRDDLTLRFPMPHKKDFIKHARSQDMTLSWPLAIARQESAFLTHATSSAGAKGLMQLMPGTARLQAKKDGVLYHSRKQLLDPAFNIQLGTAYLGQMLKRFDNNLAVAAAAYNAGPHRVKRWVNKNLSQEQWVETIPYRETRAYVKNVLAYSVIYQHHLSQIKKMPSAAINPQRMGMSNK